MKLFDIFAKKNNKIEFCPRCEANLTLQKGYGNDLPYWVCRGCGKMLINPKVDAENDIVWVCDGCGAMLNLQSGFSIGREKWKCSECGFENRIDSSEMYLSEDEFQASLHDPYRGLSDEDVLSLSVYEDEGTINGRRDIVKVRNRENQKLYVKKILTEYDVSIYRFLMDNPIEHMPRIVCAYEGQNNLVVIEEYIEGQTLEQILADGCLNKDAAIAITLDLCRILSNLHNLDRPIIHRDIKPSNIIMSKDGEVYLLDMNVSKWYKKETEDTRLFGTLYYAAPEQFGYGFSASSGKTDIYAMGILLNVMLTGKLPKEEKASGDIWNVIERCISLEPDKRYTADELIEALETIRVSDGE